MSLMIGKLGRRCMSLTPFRLKLLKPGKCYLEVELASTGKFSRYKQITSFPDGFSTLSPSLNLLFERKSHIWRI